MKKINEYIIVILIIFAGLFFAFKVFNFFSAWLGIFLIAATVYFTIYYIRLKLKKNDEN